jgi:hypothetical protein
VADAREDVPQLYRIDDREFYLVWVTTTPMALSTVDPSPNHWPRLLRWDEAAQQFTNPEFGVSYSRSGAYISGPIALPMEQFAARVIEDRVQVDVTVVKSSSTP